MAAYGNIIILLAYIVDCLALKHFFFVVIFLIVFIPLRFPLGFVNSHRGCYCTRLAYNLLKISAPPIRLALFASNETIIVLLLLFYYYYSLLLRNSVAVLYALLYVPSDIDSWLSKCIGTAVGGLRCLYWFNATSIFVRQLSLFGLTLWQIVNRLCVTKVSK